MSLSGRPRRPRTRGPATLLAGSCRLSGCLAEREPAHQAGWFV